MSRSCILRFAIVALSIAACIPEPQGAKHPEVPNLTIVTAEQGARLGIEPVHASSTFEEGQDGTRVVVDFLQRATLRGARYVSDLRVVIISEQDGKPIACETRIAPVEERVNVMVPGGFKSAPTLAPVSRMVTESQYRCRMVSEPVTRSETTYRTEYDYSRKTTRTVPKTRMVTRYEMRQKCGLEPVTRMVTRYEFQYRMQYAPPHLESVSRQKLKETQATCFTEEGNTAGEGLGKSRVEAMLYIPNATD